MQRNSRYTCFICGQTNDAEFFDGWLSCMGAPGLSGKVDPEVPECDECVDAGLDARMFRTHKFYQEPVGERLDGTPVVRTVFPWYDNRDNLLLVADYLVDQDDSVSERGVEHTLLYLLEKPWKYQYEFVAAKKRLMAQQVERSKG